MNRAVVALEYVIKNTTDEEIIPGICCSAQEMLVQGIKEVDGICNRVTRAKTGEFLVNAAMNAIRDAIELSCGQYPTVGDCEAKAANLTQRIRSAMSYNQPFYDQAHIMSLIKFVHRMDQRVTFE
jgi:hypothetical protein